MQGPETRVCTHAGNVCTCVHIQRCSLHRCTHETHTQVHTGTRHIPRDTSMHTYAHTVSQQTQVASAHRHTQAHAYGAHRCMYNTCTHVHSRTYTHAHRHIHTDTHGHTYAHSMHKLINACTHTCTQACLYTLMCTDRYTWDTYRYTLCTRKHMHTHTDTQCTQMHEYDTCTHMHSHTHTCTQKQTHRSTRAHICTLRAHT